MSSEEWTQKTWGEVATLEYGKSLKDYQKSTGNIPVYGTNGLIGFTNQPLCTFPSVIIGRKGAYRGVHYSNTPFFVIDTAFYLIPKSNNLNLKFAYYQLLTQDINSMDSGSAIPSTSREDFYNLRLASSLHSKQHRIADILSSLDEKIESNRKTNATLEAIAQAIFKEWFVDLNFPGVTGEMVKSELGMIPKGWKAGTLGELISQQTERIRNRNIPILSAIATSELVKSSDYFLKRVYSQDIQNYLLVNRWDFAYNPSGINIGSIGLLKNEEFGAVSPVYVVFRPLPQFHWFIEFFLKLNSTQNWINTLASGSVRQSLPFSELASIPIIIPPIELVNLFNNKWISLYDGITSYLEEILTLTTIRDALLPKLMSGEIDV